ncbi:hypothetical protein RR48_09859 [Papilio machaon]|uniref:Uncharacterized protein n=1 Tax=Papilio machaon TaxID=76193 RepID=A0A194R2J8_PAPMA|nr:hypothetical protein RR48_09859 [Papilio machaon]
MAAYAPVRVPCAHVLHAHTHALVSLQTRPNRYLLAVLHSVLRLLEQISANSKRTLLQICNGRHRSDDEWRTASPSLTDIAYSPAFHTECGRSTGRWAAAAHHPASTPVLFMFSYPLASVHHMERLGVENFASGQDTVFSDNVPERIDETSATSRRHDVPIIRPSFAESRISLTFVEKPSIKNILRLQRTDNPVIVCTAQIYTTPKRQHK